MGLSTVTLHGPLFLEDNETPAQGTLSFTLSAPLQDLDNHRTVSPVPVEVTLDASGQFSVPLAATSGPNVVPDGVTYRCVYQPVGGPRVVLHFGLPPSPSSVNFSSLAPALPVSPSYSYALSADLAAEVARAEAAEALAVPLAQKGAANGVATLDSGAKIPPAQLPALAINEIHTVASQAAMLALAANPGDIAIRTDVGSDFQLAAAPASTLGNWVELAFKVTSVDGFTGAVVLPGDGAAGTATKRTLGTGATQAAAGNDARLSDQRTPLDGSVTDAKVNASAAIAATKINFAFNINILTQKVRASATASAGLQSAIDACQSSGRGAVELGAGTHVLDSAVLQIARNNGRTAPLRFFGQGEDLTTIMVTGTAPRVLDFARIADYDTFQDIEIAGFTVDVNNVGGRHHVILGTYIGGAFTSGQRANFNHIRVEDWKIVNAPVDSTTTNHRLGIFIQVEQITSGEATQNFFTDIAVRRGRMEGGNQGVCLMGGCQAGGTNTNILYDDILLEDLWHSLLAGQTVQFSSANFQVGSRASGKTVRLVRCKGFFSGDVGIEIDGATRATVEDCEFLDAFGSPVYFTNLNAPSGGITAQTLNAVRTKVHHKALMAIHAPFDFDGGQGFGLGTCRMSDCEVVQESGIVSATPPADWAHFHGGIGAIDIDGFTGWTNGYNFTDPVTALSQFAIRVAPSPASNAATTVRMRKVTGRFDGTYSGVANTTWGLLSVAAGGNVILDVEASFSGSCVGGGGSFFRGADIGTGGTVGTIKGHAKIDIPTNAITGGAGAEAFVFRDTNPTLVAPFRISGDWAGCSTQVAFANSPTNKDKVFFEDYRPPTFPVLQTAISVTASPFTYQNLDGYAERVTIGNDNGPVTKIEISTDNSTFSDTKLTTGQFTLDNASAIRVTYSGSAPTMLKVPAK